MTILERLFASSGTEVIIPTFEITCDAWSEPILLCNGYEDQTCITEDARTLTFVASGIQAALPKRDTSGTQSLRFAIDNVTGQAQSLIDQALEAEEIIRMTFRHYVSSDLTAPAENPLKFVIREGSMEGSVLQINATFFDMINVAWPRNFYTPEFAPGLKYL